MKMSQTKKLMITAACIALCVLLGRPLGAVSGGSGFVYAPVLLCGLVCSWRCGLLCGAAAPALCALFTGAPAAALLPAVMAECAVYGAAAGLMMGLVRTGRGYGDVYISLLTAMIAGRLTGGAVRALIFASDGYAAGVWAAARLAAAVPGMVLCAALLPWLILSLEKAGLIPARYPPIQP